MIEKIVSGGQTGADRAALDFAPAHGIPHGGWCPRGRLAEDGPIAAHFQLQETSTKRYVQRTEANVRESDATVIFTLAAVLTGGSRRTAEFAARYSRPWLHLHPATKVEPAALLANFLRQHGVRVLNVAGSRASKEPTVGDFVHIVLTAALAGC